MANIEMNVVGEDKSKASFDSAAASLRAMTVAQKTAYDLDKAHYFGLQEDKARALAALLATENAAAATRKQTIAMIVAAEKTAAETKERTISMIVAAEQVAARQAQAAKDAAYALDKDHYFALKEDKQRALNAIVSAEKEAAKQQAASAKLQAEKTAELTVGYGLLVDAIKSAALQVVAFGKESVHAFIEADKIARQLTRTAGDMAGAFDAQAGALSEAFAVDDEMVKMMEVQLLQWGEAPSKVGATTEAILNYAAAMNKEPLDATREFIRATENGGEKLKALGIHFEQTGDKAKDAAALTQLFATKFAGAGAANAGGLAGDLGRTTTALGNLKEAFGELIGVLNTAAGQTIGEGSLLGLVAKGMKGGASFLGAMAADVRENGLPSSPFALGQRIGGALGSVRGGRWGGPTGVFGLDEGDTVSTKISDPLAFVPLMGEELAPSVKPGQFANRGGGRSAASRAVVEADRSQRETDLDKELNNYNERMDAQWVGDRKREQEAEKVAKAQAEKTAKAAEKAAADAAKRAADAAEQQQQRMEAAGEALGLAFVGGLSTQLAKLAGGGEFDLAEFLLNLLPAAGGLAGMAIGGPGGAALGGAIGTGLSQIGGAFAHRKMHDGGWVGLPRYHSGTWVGSDEHAAILQSGERVLSRSEVSRMGGAQGVDGAARGGGAVTVNVQAFDGSSAAAYFGGAGGRAMTDALRLGRGSLVPLFGG